MKDLISVIVLTYNNLDYIKDTINSIVCQDYPNIEVIIGDDNSKDFDLQEIRRDLNKIKGNIKNLIIYSNDENIGTVKNLNKAIKLANGKIIIPLAGDDQFLKNNIISKIVSFFEISNCDICTAKRMVIDRNGNEIGIFPKKDDICFLKKDINKLLKRLVRGNFIFGSCTYYKKNIFDKYGYFDEDFVLLEDYPYYLRLLCNNVKINFLNEITIKYRQIGVSSGKKHPLLIEDDKRVYNLIIFKMKDKIGVIRYRESKFDYYKKYCQKSKLRFIIKNLQYIDVLILKVIRKIMR